MLLTDGEDHDEMALKTAKEMAEQGMLINTIGIGTAQGSKIPDPVTGGFKKDQMGNEVVSKLNENILKQLAETANGVYVPLSDGDAAIDKIVSQLSQIEKKTIIDTSLVNYHSYYWIFAGLMLLLLILEFFISPSKKQKA